MCIPAVPLQTPTRSSPMKKTAQKSVETKKSLFTIAAKELKLVHGGRGVIVNGPS